MRHRGNRVAVRASAVAIVVLLGGCGPGGEDLTEPREILTRTLTETAGLRTVTVRAELQVRDANNPNAGVGGVDGGALEAQVDLVASAFSGRFVNASGVEQGRLIYVDGSLFVKDSAGARWQQTVIPPEAAGNPAFLFLDGGAPGGSGPDIVGILGQAIQGPALRMALAGVEECATGRCYRTTVEIPPDALWPLAMGLTGMDRVPGFQPAAPDPGQLPQISLSILTDTATLRLVEVSGAGKLDAVAAQVRVQLAEHDAPVSIGPPPAELVDQPFGGGVLPPQPVPAPLPAAQP